MSVRFGDGPANGMEAASGALVGGGVAGPRSGARAANAVLFGGAASSLGGAAGMPKGAGVIVITRPVSDPVPEAAAGDLPFDFLRSVTVITGSTPLSDARAGAGAEAILSGNGNGRRRLSIGPGGGDHRRTLLGQPRRNRAPDALRGTGDERDLSSHRHPPIRMSR